MIIGGPKMRGRNVGDLGGGGEGAGEGEMEGGWVGGWVGSSCGSSDATTAASLSLLRLLSSSLSSDTVFLFWLLSLSRRIWNEMSSNQLHFWDLFCFSSVAVALLLCYVHALLFSLIFRGTWPRCSFFLSRVVCFVFFFSLVFWVKF